MFTFEENFNSRAKLKVVGIGGAGGNAINRMVEEGLEHVEFIAVNTDAQDLDRNRATCRIQVGERITKGLGAGAKPEVGRCAMEEDRNVIIDKLEGADMVFITAGMGGGTGTGGAPIVASIAQEMGILTIAIVSKPFLFEGIHRMRNADNGIMELRKYVDTIIVIPNQRLLSMIDKKTPMIEAFKRADDVLYQGTRGISDLININGLVNIDFADAETVMRGMGDALMGTGYASGDGMAIKAAEMAIRSPLLEDVSIKGAKGVLINITGGEDLPLHDVSEVSNYVYEAVGEDNNANIVIGAVTDPTMQGQIRVTVIATGFNKPSMLDKLSSLEKETIAKKVTYMGNSVRDVRKPAAPVEIRHEDTVASKELDPAQKTPVTSTPFTMPEVPQTQTSLFTNTNERKTEEDASQAVDMDMTDTREIENLIERVEKGVEIIKSELPPQPVTSTLPATPLIDPAKAPQQVLPEKLKAQENLYAEAAMDVEKDKKRSELLENRVRRFNSLQDLLSDQDFKNHAQDPAVKNVGQRLGRSMKQDKAVIMKNGLLSHELHDDLEVPTFLRQQMD